MVRNLTIEEFAKVRELGQIAENVSKIAEANNLSFIFEFSFGIYEAKAYVRLDFKDIDLVAVEAISLNIFEGEEYARIQNALELAYQKATNSRVQRIAYYEKMIAELKERRDA